MMAFLHALGISGLFAFVLFYFVKRVLARKAVALRDIPGPSKEHWLKGNYHKIFQDGLNYNLSLIDKYGGAFKVHAILGAEQLYISDPLALQHIVIKEQHIYEETDMFIMGNRLIFGEGLISTLGEQHRKQRKLLNPVFSTANMRELYPVIQPIADQLCRTILSEVATNESKEIDVLPWISRGALEYISCAALGHSFNALDPNNRSEYLDAIRMLAPTTLRLLFLRPFIPFLVSNFSTYWRNIMVSWAPIPALKDICHMVQLMDDTSKEIFHRRKVALQEGRDETREPDSLVAKLEGKDILSIMLNANMSSSEIDNLSDAELVGQMNTFIFGGLETVTSAICRILHILASEPSIQTRLRAEIRLAKCARIYEGCGLTECGTTKWEDVILPYSVLNGLLYLDAVVKETMRLHPPTSLLSRTTRQDAILPLSRPICSRSGKVLDKMAIPKGTTLILSILAANLDKGIWGEDARKWKPDRWLEARNGICTVEVGDDTSGELPDKKGGIRYPGVYASMMTFLGGERACIGFKFAEMEIKQIITTLLSHLHFSLPDTPDGNEHRKEVQWKLNPLQVPVVPPPAGDGMTPQVPLTVRAARTDDFFMTNV